MTITIRHTKQGEGRGDHPTDKGIIPEILQQTFEEMEKQVAESVKSIKSKLVVFEERMEEKFIEMKEVTKTIGESIGHLMGKINLMTKCKCDKYIL